MSELNHLETYINAQKDVATHFVLIGIGLLLIALLCHFFSNSSLGNGLKIGGIICGIFILLGGIGYRNTETKLLKTQSGLLAKDKVEFHRVESERMAKVVKDYPIYQIGFGAFIIVSLFIVWFIKIPFWNGIAFAVIILFVLVMISEAFSYKSINEYNKHLTNRFLNGKYN